MKEKETATKSFYEKIAPVMMIALVGLVVVVGALWQKIVVLESGVVQAPAAGDTAVDPGIPSSGKLTEDQATKIPAITAKDHISGSSNPQVYLLEYSDFQCPFCSRFHLTTQQALEEYGDKLALVYRHFPLDSLHPQARPAAIASECINKLGGNAAFWKFVDAVFADQAALKDIPALAVQAGVNKQAFDSCVSSKEFDSVVEDSYQEGMAAGVTGTPGNFIINSKGEVWVLPGAVPYESLKAAIDEALASN